jgi:hypothetical protein
MDRPDERPEHCASEKADRVTGTGGHPRIVAANCRSSAARGRMSEQPAAATTAAAGPQRPQPASRAAAGPQRPQRPGPATTDALARLRLLP